VVEQRDGGCRVPGCSQRRWLHVHHLQHHAHGGPTAVGNLVCLCPAHHRLLHAGHLHVTGDPVPLQGLVFTDRHGRTIGPSPPSPTGGRTPRQAARNTGLHPHPTTGPTCEPFNAWSILWN
jgi:hypothetical protein